MKKELTERQEEILSFIHKCRDLNGFPPTLREIAKNFNIASTFGVKRHLDALKKKGYLKVEANASRGISLVPDEELNSDSSYETHQDLLSARQIPIVGRVAAGSPIMAVENMEGNIIIDPALLRKSDEGFALKVQGDSMIDAGIFEGDYVIVVTNKDVVNGDIVVAMLGEEVTVKRFEKRNNKVFLIPENVNYSPIEVENRNDFKILGKVKGVMRWFN
jgi:repressor LexA